MNRAGSRLCSKSRGMSTDGLAHSRRERGRCSIRASPASTVAVPPRFGSGSGEPLVWVIEPGRVPRIDLA